MISVNKRDLVSKFVERLKAIGINVELHGNYPWVYLAKVNDILVTERFQANHGFTAFILRRDGSFTWSDRRRVFQKVREMLK